MSVTAFAAARSDIARLILSLVSAEGTAGHPYPMATALSTGPDATRNLADAVHYLGVLHGRQPDLIDQAAMRHPASEIGRSLARAAESFAGERGYLARLSVAAGPQPSTPGQADCENAVLAQNHALSMLSRSDRTGTALGAATALILDWRPVRMVLDLAAERLGISVEPCTLPGPDALLPAMAEVATGPGIERAIAFGAQQFLLQQRGLWDLLYAREGARRLS